MQIVPVPLLETSCQTFRKEPFGVPLSGAVNPPHSQILRIDREGMTYKVIMHGYNVINLCKKYLLTPIVTNLR